MKTLILGLVIIAMAFGADAINEIKSNQEQIISECLWKEAQ